MFLGALAGALLLLHTDLTLTLGLALLLLAATSAASVATYRLSASDTDWTRPSA